MENGKKLKQIRDAYVIRQVDRVDFPVFSDEGKRRYRICFKGRVQKVGFRLEVCQLAERLGLTGWCKNLENGDVLAEIQGNPEKIRFLISFMEQLKRIRIDEKIMEELEIIADETAFSRR